MHRLAVGPVTVELVVGDLTAQPDVDVIVNAANAELTTGGGVAGAIHRAAGPQLEEACRPLAPIATGQAVRTEAFALPNRAVIHVLGPVYGRDEPAAELLAAGHREALRLAEEAGDTTIAFPAVSTGVFGYPVEEAAAVAVRTVVATAPELTQLRTVRFVLFDEVAFAAFERALTTVARP
ncbi:RNase III inhibitor [Nitriliruptoraceae bacterium ZYF776]|nr:RNase III inhibitor [Profundirhabdus halotolerans]